MLNQSLLPMQTCHCCSFSHSCLRGIPVQNKAVASLLIYERQSSLYLLGDPFSSLYVLRSGSAKTYVNTESGHEQISSFHYPGDVLGLEGFDSMVHSSSLQFLETSSVCRISLKNVNNAMDESREVRQRLLAYMSRSIRDEQLLLMSLNQYDSKQRVIKFLLDLSEKMKRGGLSRSEFNLSMSRIDIANFLGLAIETISRLLTKMDAQGLIKVQNRKITLYSIDALKTYLLVPSD